MPRKQRTEEEKAQTHLTEMILEGKEGELVNAITYDIGCIIKRMENRFQIDNREACCALRDYAQLLVARHMDLAAAGMDEQLLRLKAELEKKLANS